MKPSEINPYPQILVCPDPENCTEWHNEGSPEAEQHHYGCECSDCVAFYRSLK